MAWMYLFLAGLFEIFWAYWMKKSEGFTMLTPSIITLIGMILSIVLLSWSMRTLPLGTAYTIWTGIGAVGAFIVGFVMLGETFTLMRLTAALLILSGIIMMKVSFE